MSKDKREGWLAELKIGDQVVVSRSYYGEEIDTVRNITPTGRIDVAGHSCRFHAYGSAIGEVYSRTRLEQLTPELENRIKNRKLLQELNAVTDRLIRQAPDLNSKNRRLELVHHLELENILEFLVAWEKRCLESEK